VVEERLAATADARERLALGQLRRELKTRRNRKSHPFHARSIIVVEALPASAHAHGHGRSVAAAPRHVRPRAARGGARPAAMVDEPWAARPSSWLHWTSS
jgi:hypothetical protein